MANDSLNKAKIEKNDEFYTLMEDIENELSRYDFSQFKDKVVYCNCDDPTWSNFFKFFTKWAKRMGIKEVHFTNYANAKRTWNDQLTLFDLYDLRESADDDKKGTAHHWIFKPESNKIIKKSLKGDGDFRSKECIDILDKSDIVVTNPPFSLLTEFLSVIISRNKKFLIVGNENEIASKSWCSYFVNNQIWLGYTHPKKFLDNNSQTKNMGFICWYTNLEVSYRNSPLILHYQDLSQFKKYDNYDAIEIPKTKLIPDNYWGNMGVPIFFAEKFCPEQFVIVDTSPAYGMVPKINGKKCYRRLIIRRKV